MKRLNTALCILTVIVCIACYTTWDIHMIVQELDGQLTNLRTMPQGDAEELKEASDHLLETWNGYEDRLVLYVNHSTLDTLTLQLAELPALVEYEEYSFIYSKIDATIELLDDLWKATIPNYRNLL